MAWYILYSQKINFVKKKYRNEKLCSTKRKSVVFEFFHKS